MSASELPAGKVSYRLLTVVAAVTFFLDQLTKGWALSGLTNTFLGTGTTDLTFGEKVARFFTYRHPGARPAVSVIDNFWHFRYAENPGAAWSFLGNAPDDVRLPVLLGIAIAACAGIVWYYRKSGTLMTRWALALILGGALGNLFDRLRFSYVIDFIDWHWYDLHWPTFNIADVGIVAGVGLMMIEMYKDSRAQAQAKRSVSSGKKGGKRGKDGDTLSAAKRNELPA